jgi:hypothetical protein
LGGAIDPVGALDVIRRLCDEVELLHPALAAIAVEIPAAMPDEVRSLWALALGVAQRGAQPRRKYR